MRLIMAALLLTACSVEGQSQNNRGGPQQACTSSRELMKYESMNLGVRMVTSRLELTTQFENAMAFWASIIDMHWHIEPTSVCAVQVFDGEAELFKDSTVAKAHLVDTNGFSGWIAFNPKAPLTRDELYLTAIHEIGHLLGLSHNANTASVMYYTNRSGSDLLDTSDLAALSKEHRLRKTVRNILVNRGWGSKTGIPCNELLTFPLPPS
jgi:hypothetical protein